jgi:hypothetical protein
LSSRIIIKILAYAWASPYSLIGLLWGLLAVLSGAKTHVHEGTLEITGGRTGKWYAKTFRKRHITTITLGHVILSKNESCLHDLRLHEKVHVKQYEKWGVLFAPAYFISSIVQIIRGRNPYLDNVFEIAAFKKNLPE